MFQFLVVLCLLVSGIVWLYKKFKAASTSQTLEQANRKVGELTTKFDYFNELHAALDKKHSELITSYQKLQHQKISSDVKMGQKSENLLPFLEDFPYRDEEIRGLFNPIDLIVFTDTEVVFVEVKTGTASLSDKQRRIRDNIQQGRVRFEVHRMNEKGITVK